MHKLASLPANKGRAEVLRAALFKACLRLIPNCGHVPHEEVPAETIKLIGDFLPK
jgi:hypothetical protein